MTNFARINYGGGVAQLWGEFDAQTVQQEFYSRANQCFGIRKSISGFTLLALREEPFPEVFGVEATKVVALLQHNGDTIAWGRDGNKLRSEWD